MDEIEQHFVEAAPFSEDRQLIFDALSVWVRQMRTLLPGARCWVDGGFTTHKGWAAPSDVDVVVFATQAELDALDPAQQAQLESLLTEQAEGGARRQPMGGLVDGFLSVRNEPGSTIYWRNQWSRVRGNDGSELHAERKGFLEVIV